MSPQSSETRTAERSHPRSAVVAIHRTVRPSRFTMRVLGHQPKACKTSSCQPRPSPHTAPELRFSPAQAEAYCTATSGEGRLRRSGQRPEPLRNNDAVSFPIPQGLGATQRDPAQAKPNDDFFPHVLSATAAASRCKAPQHPSQRGAPPWSPSEGRVVGIRRDETSQIRHGHAAGL